MTEGRMGDETTESATPEPTPEPTSATAVPVVELVLDAPIEAVMVETEECSVAHMKGPCPRALPRRFAVGIAGFAITTHRDATGLDHDMPAPGRKQVRGERVVLEADTAAAAREAFSRRFGVRSSKQKPIKVSDA
jgi:hypothetical protein